MSTFLDSQIREPLRNFLHECTTGMWGEQEFYLRDEVSLKQHPDTRADLIVSAPEWLFGVEIKSRADSLQRLPRQIPAYNAVCDRVLLVADSQHLEQAEAMVPDWWGLAEVGRQGEAPEIHHKRYAELNPEVCGYCRLKILWKSELQEVLQELKIGGGLLSQAMRRIYREVPERIDSYTLLEPVSRKIFDRGSDWWPDPLAGLADKAQAVGQ